MIYKKLTLLTLSVGMIVPAAFANVAPVIPTGSIACMTRKDIQSYELYIKQAPDFAQDLMARAICYKVEKPEEAVRLGAEKGYARLKVLSGHIVWVNESALK
jgi:hypothetical protein